MKSFYVIMQKSVEEHDNEWAPCCEQPPVVCELDKLPVCREGFEDDDRFVFIRNRAQELALRNAHNDRFCVYIFTNNLGVEMLTPIFKRVPSPIFKRVP